MCLLVNNRQVHHDLLPSAAKRWEKENSCTCDEKTAAEALTVSAITLFGVFPFYVLLTLCTATHTTELVRVYASIVEEEKKKRGNNFFIQLVFLFLFCFSFLHPRRVSKKKKIKKRSGNANTAMLVIYLP